MNFGEYKGGLLDEESALVLEKGEKIDEIEKFGVVLKKFSLSQGKKLSYQYNKGNYVIADCGRASDENIISVLSKELKMLLCEKTKTLKKILCCGIGNPYMTADALGVESVRKLMKKRKDRVKLLIPYLEGLTGISSGTILKSVVDAEKVDLIILIDSLAGTKIERIGKSYQFTDAGIVPGGAVGANKSYDKVFLGVKTIAIGVPTVIRTKIEQSDKFSDLLTPKDIDVIIENSSDIVSKIIQKALD